jgi:hypothetical protein
VRHTLRLNFSNRTEDRIAEGIRRPAGVLKAALADYARHHGFARFLGGPTAVSAERPGRRRALQDVQRLMTP